MISQKSEMYVDVLHALRSCGKIYISIYIYMYIYIYIWVMFNHLESMFTGSLV